jgi:hypothetical protein
MWDKKSYKTARQSKEDMLNWVRANINSRIEEEWPLVRDKEIDPLVVLLIESLASELSQTYGFIYDSEKRVIEHLANILLPNQVEFPFPAHAVAHAGLKSGSVPLGQTAQLYYLPPGKEKGEVDVKKEGIGFTPAVDTRLVAGSVAYLATNYLLWQTESKAFNQPVVSIGNPEEASDYSDKLFIGIALDPQIVSLEGTRLFFELAVNPFQGVDTQQDRAFYYALAEGEWSFNGRLAKILKGFGNGFGDVSELLDPIRKMKLDILSRYQPSFITLSSDLTWEKREKFEPPSFLRSNLPANILANIQEEVKTKGLNLVWLEVKLPYALKFEDVPRRLSCRLNCFPVINRMLEIIDGNDVYFSKASINAVQVPEKNPILGIERVYERGSEVSYTYLPFAEFKRNTVRTYTLRQGGMKVSDSFNIWKELAHLIGLARDNYQYSGLRDRLGGVLSAEEWDYLLKQAMEEEELKEQGPKTKSLYVLLNVGSVLDGGKRLCIDYWITNGLKANKIGVGSRLEDINGLMPTLEEGGLRLLHETTGGKIPNAQAEERWGELRHLLLSRDKIVTMEDVKSFVRSYFGDKAVEVTLEKGIEIDPRPGFGPTRVIEVHLKVDKEADFSEGYWLYLKKQVEGELSRRSTSVIPFRIHFDQVAAETKA